MPRNYHENVNVNNSRNIIRKYEDREERAFREKLGDRFRETFSEENHHHHHHHQPHHSNHHSNNSSQSPSREFREEFLDEYELFEPDNILRMKWLDNSPRMSRLRDHREKRLINRLEQFELWDADQELKQKQHDLDREQRYRNIIERLKSQDFCVQTMKKRHESDLETTRELEYQDHLYVDALDDPSINYKGPLTQYRKFQHEMDDKLKHLQNDIDTLNPRFKISQSILPRLERTREVFSVEPEVYTKSGKRLLKKPDFKIKPADDTLNTPLYLPSRTASNYSTSSKSLTRSSYGIKPIIHTSNHENLPARSISKQRISIDRKVVNFEDDDYSPKHRISERKKFSRY